MDKAANQYAEALIKKCGRPPTRQDLDDYVDICMEQKGYGKNYLKNVKNR
jgi:hypothetical protein